MARKQPPVSHTESHHQEDAALDFDPATLERQPGDDTEAEQPRKKWTPPQDPFGFENHKGTGNRVRLLKSESLGAYVIRFDKNPSTMEGFSKDHPHPVIAMLKSEGYKWGFDKDGTGGWGKPFQGDPYGQDHIEARRVLKKAAEMIGAPVEQEVSR